MKGENGSGKTSLLEAISYCSMLKSFRGVPREAVVRLGCESAQVESLVRQGSRRVEIGVRLVPGRRDEARVNGQRAAGAKDLAQVLRTTLFTPDDLALVKGGPAGRRDLLDDALVSTSPQLAAERASFERSLRQRNALLRQLSGRMDGPAELTLDVWDERLSMSGEKLATGRERLVSSVLPFAAAAFSVLAPDAGLLDLAYERSFAGDLAGALAASRAEDVRRQVTTVGPQRDDLVITAGGLDARSRLSQGRQRCVALALRLGIHHYVTEVTGAVPLLLLDDAFSELDERTSKALVAELPAAQAILTTAGELPLGAEPDRIVRIAGGSLS